MWSDSWWNVKPERYCFADAFQRLTMVVFRPVLGMIWRYHAYRPFKAKGLIGSRNNICCQFLLCEMWAATNANRKASASRLHHP